MFLMLLHVFVKSLKRLNEDVNQHVLMAERGRKIKPRIGLLVLARHPSDGQYVMCYINSFCTPVAVLLLALLLLIVVVKVLSARTIASSLGLHC